MPPMDEPITTAFIVPDGMPASVFRDKYARRRDDGSFETWEECATRTVIGNLSLRPDNFEDIYEQQRAELLRLAVKGVIPFSGRHLQHGDADQRHKIAELFVNCTSSMFSWTSFLLLMKGCGVGRDYSSDMCYVDWDYLPNCRFVLAGPDKLGKGGHPDYQDWIESLDEAKHKYDPEGERVRWFEVGDSAEGWARVVMIMETAAFHKHNADTIFVFDFSKVRRRGAPLRGQQNRPASGPVPFIRALLQVMSIKGAGMKPWKQAMFVDHYLAGCVVVGGVRRAARDAVKSCHDRDVIEFIDIKRGGYLWSANNSILSDTQFWEKAQSPKPSHDRRVYEAAAGSAYWDDTGEPGFFNVDLVNDDSRNLGEVTTETYLSAAFVERMGGLHARTSEMIEYHLNRAKLKRYRYIPNPCFEIPLAIWGAYCDIGDICLANTTNLEEVITAARRLAEALVRVNTMTCMYEAETRRTNRIGVSLTGIHEFLWRAWGLSFRQAINPSDPVAYEFWMFIGEVRRAVEEAADEESVRCGLPTPATYTCIKPSGTISKVMGCTEGAHLPAKRHYVRWVAFQHGSSEVRRYEAAGYPVKDVSHQYRDTVVVGFPTCLPIVNEIPDGLLVTASEATPEEQFAWLRLLEKHWLGDDRRNGQVSYTLKWQKSQVGFEDYLAMVLREQPTVRCCAMMPELEQDGSAYAYLPEEPVTKAEYDALVARIAAVRLEAYDAEALACEGGACPIERDIHDSSIGVGA